MNVLPGPHQQRVSAAGAHRFSVCVLLCVDSDHSVHCHVVPSIRDLVAHLGVHGPQLVLQQEERGFVSGCID